MKIDPQLVIKLRNKCSWSQDELSIAAGLNVRTIQRIENEGVISLQSKKALASAFDIGIDELDYIEPSFKQCFEYKTVVLTSDIKWLSGWNKSQNTGPFELDNIINQYGLKGWRVHTINHGSSVHGGAGQVMVMFEREMAIEV